MSLTINAPQDMNINVRRCGINCVLIEIDNDPVVVVIEPTANIMNISIDEDGDIVINSAYAGWITDAPFPVFTNHNLTMAECEMIAELCEDDEDDNMTDNEEED